MSSTSTHTAGATNAWHLHSLVRAELGPVAQKDEIWQQRDFFSRLWAIGHVAQILQNENVCLNENENRKTIVVTRERAALGTELLQKHCCFPSVRLSHGKVQLGWMEEAVRGFAGGRLWEVEDMRALCLPAEPEELEPWCYSSPQRGADKL